MAACLRSLATGPLRPAHPLSERLLHLTPLVSVVLADDCYLHGHYGFRSAPTYLVTTGSRSLGEVLREAGKRFSVSGFPDEFRLALPSFLLEPLSLGTAHERLLKKPAVNPMFAIDCAADVGYLFSKDGASDNEDYNGVEALIEAVKRKSRSLTRLLQENEDKKRETDKRNKEDDKNRKESEDKKREEWEEKNREAEEIRKQLRRQARFWDRVTLRLLLVASRLKGKSTVVNEEEKTRLGKIVKTVLIFLRGPSTAKEAWEAVENGAALWLLGIIMLGYSCYLGERDFWDLLEGRKMAIINKAERMLGVQAPPGKCICGADLPTLCAHCGEDLPHFLIRQGAGLSKGKGGAVPDGKVGDLTEAGSEGNAGAVAEDK